MAGLEQRVSELEKWRRANEPMLRQLAEDQAYRARWQAERAKRWSRWQRRTAFTVATVSALAVVVSSFLEIAHLLGLSS